MAYDIATLKTIRDNALTAIANAYAVTGAPGSVPDASGGGDLKHTDFIERQEKLIEWCNKQIAIADGAWELETRSPW